MTPQDFIAKWKVHALTERAAAQEHFLDLCKVFGHPTPAEDDPGGERFTFEKGVVKTGGGDGWADVWKKGAFAFEYKKRRRNLDEALRQIASYAAGLEHPPLHVACDTVRFKIVTAWTNEIPATYEFDIDDLAEPENLRVMHALFHNPEELRSKKSRAALTERAANEFQAISDRLQHRNPDREEVAHFVNQLVFCFFADSVKLLPDGIWRKLLLVSAERPSRAKGYLDRLFADMHAGGDFDMNLIREFNGGLFDGRLSLGLERGDIELLISLTSLDWSLIDPTIFGTLFERFLDPDKRAQIGAHYTDLEKITMIVKPVVLHPLEAEWAKAKTAIGAAMALANAGEKSFGRDAAKQRQRKLATARANAERLRDNFLERLCNLRILDPACGSGNFLYVALQLVKDLEYKAILESEDFGLARRLPRVSPQILRGIELNPFAAELARTTIWIGDIQWRLRNVVMHHPQPILGKLDNIECRDALVTKAGEGYVAAAWPEADFIVGNPPFLGGKKLRHGSPARYKSANGVQKLVQVAKPGLGDEYVDRLFHIYKDVVAGESDLVCYWFAKAWQAIEGGQAKAAGLVATNSIRGGANRRVLAPLATAKAIFEAWSDEPWVLDGAAVRVSIVCFGSRSSESTQLDGVEVETIFADLAASGANVSIAARLPENAGVAFMGNTKGGAFDIPGALARAWLREPLNVNGRPNSDVLKPWVNGLDLTRRPRDMWLIDFGLSMSEEEASHYEQPYGYVRRNVKPERATNRRDAYRMNWWRHMEARPALQYAVSQMKRVISTPTIAKHRFFAVVDALICSDHALIVIARDDDTSFGILHSRFHEAWSLRLGTSLEDRPRYTPTTTFATFPFPQGLTPNIPAQDYAADPRAQKIAAAAKRLDERRRAWLNPPDLVDIVPEVVPGYPDRIVPRTVEAAARLKERTLTNLYNQRPQWLASAHETLDRAVAAAYGWPEDIALEEALARLLALNLERSGG